MTVGNEDAPVTNRIFRTGLESTQGILRQEMSAMRDSLRGEMSAMGAGLRGEMASMKDELRDEMQAGRQALAVEVVRNALRMDRLEDRIDVRFNAMSSDIIGKIDGFMAQVGRIDRAQVIADWRVREVEQRVTALEQRPSS